MQQFGVCGKNILCVGARDDSEANFFRKLGMEADGIDLYSSGKIIECDMSKMLEHPYLKNKEYDIIFASDSLEHCADLCGFIQGLNKLCKNYFVCFGPSANGALEGINIDNWDCAIHKFMTDNSNFAKNLLDAFCQFDIVTSQLDRGGKKLFFILKKKMTSRKESKMSSMIYPKFWDATFKYPISKNYKISFCITCMNRLDNLRKTLPVNIKDNKDYPNLEFVIIDYNSIDGLWDWMKDNMLHEIESGKVSYYRTTEPKYFNMSHSRNIAFKVATGDIVNNLDADNYTKSSNKEISECWALYLNRLANQQNEKVIFAKGKRKMHGRIGFYKKDFIELLGGYDEDLLGYGHDDHDLVQRAWGLGFSMFWWGGQYIDRIHTSRNEKGSNLERGWKITEDENKKKSESNLVNGLFKANEGKHWGKANLIKNFSEEILI